MSKKGWHYQKSKIDLDQLAIEIRRMKPTCKLHKVLKKELTPLGRWRNLKRGKPRRYKKPENISG